MWQLVQANAGQDAGRTAPAARSKHAVCFASDGHIYLFGGKSKHSPLKDLWRFDSEQNYWEEIKCEGDCPPCLQNHSMNAWNDKLYVFGGEVGYDSSDTPMWQLDLNVCQWTKWQSVHVQSPGISGQQPTGRSGHSSVLSDNKLCIFGGYQALNGTLNDLWTFDLETEKWLCVSGSTTGNQIQPASRYLHSAVVYRRCMYIYGGMNNLQPKSDFWKWDFDKSRWSKIKCGKGPGELAGHSAVRVHDNMYMFGGERVGHFLNELWQFNFVSENWTKIQAEGSLAMGTIGPYVAIANPLFELMEFHEQQIESELTESESNESKLCDFVNEQSANVNKNKCAKKEKSKSSVSFRSKENYKDSRHCNCKSKSANVFRRLFRKRLMRAKFGSNGATYECESCIKRKDAGSSAKCSAAECDDCKSSLTLCNRCLQSSQDTLKHSSQVSSASLATSTNSSSTTNTITTSTTTGLIGPTKFEIGQFEDENVGASAPLHSSSTETSEDELILRLNVLQKQLTDRDSSPSPSSPPNANKTDVLYARFDPKKPRPKSELIAELISLEEDINDSWDGIDLKRHSVHESMSYYSLCFPSPSYAAAPTATTSKPTPSSDWMPNLTKATLRNPTAGVQRTPKQARPKSYQPDGPIVHSNGSSIVGNGPTKSTSPPTQQTIATTSNVMANQSNQNESLADSFTMESISHSMSQSSGYQSLLDECDSSSFSALGSQSIQHRKPTSSCTTLRRNGQPVLTSAHAQQYSQRDCNSFDAGLFALPVETAFAAADSLEQLESTSSISSSNTTHNCASFASYASNRLPNSISGGLELTLDSAAQHRLYQRSYQFRPLPRAFSLDKKLSSARTVSNPLWTRFHAIKEVIAPSSPALRKKLHKSVTHKFVRRRFVRSTGKDELQLAMYVFGGQTATNHCQPLSVWKLYV